MTQEQPLPPDQDRQRLLEEIRALKVLLNWTLLAGLVLSGTLSIYFLREAIVIRRQISANLQYVSEYETSIDNLRGKLQAFSKTNPDIAPMLRFFTNSVPSSQSPRPVEGLTK